MPKPDIDSDDPYPVRGDIGWYPGDVPDGRNK